jgi:hypothetical protein
VAADAIVSVTSEIRAVPAIKQAMPFSEDRHRPLKRAGPVHQITVGFCGFEMDQEVCISAAAALLMAHAVEGRLQNLGALLQSTMFFVGQFRFEHADDAAACHHTRQ